MERAGREERKRQMQYWVGLACVLQEGRPAGEEIVLIRGWHITGTRRRGIQMSRSSSSSQVILTGYVTNMVRTSVLKP